MPGQVTFVLNAEDAKAVSAFLRIFEAQKKVEGGMRDIHKASTDAEGGIEQLGKKIGEGIGDSLQNLAAGFVTLEGLKDYIGGVAQNFDQLAEAGAKLETTVTPLLAMGDNASHAQRVKAELMDLSVAYGTTADSMVNAMTMAEGMNAGTQAEREFVGEAHELTEAIGGDLSANLSTMIKLWIAFGDEAGSAGKISSEMLAAIKAGMPREDLELIARVTPAAKEAGFTPEDLFATISSTVHWGGSDQRLMRGMESVLAGFDTMKQKAAEAGIALQGGPMDNLQQIATFAAAHPDIITTMFPKGEGVWLKELGQHIADIQKAAQQFGNTPPGGPQQEINKRMTDPAFAMANAHEMISSAMGSSDAIRAQDPSKLKLDMAYQLTQLGHKLTASPWESEKSGQVAIGAEMGSNPFGSDDFTMGLNTIMKSADEAAKAGKSKEEVDQIRAQADYIKLVFGQASGLKLQGGSGMASSDPDVASASGAGTFVADKFTDVGDAKQFADLRAGGYDLTADTFFHYETLNQSDPKAAANFLAGHKAKPPAPQQPQTMTYQPPPPTPQQTAANYAGDLAELNDDQAALQTGADFAKKTYGANSYQFATANSAATHFADERKTAERGGSIDPEALNKLHTEVQGTLQQLNKTLASFGQVPQAILAALARARQNGQYPG